MQRQSTIKPAGPPGIFETIAGAMSVLLIHPWTLLLPIALDVYLWLGARLSPAALTRPVARWIDDQGGADAEWLVEVLGRLGTSGDLTVLVGWLVPSLVAGIDRADLAGAWSRPTLSMGSAPLVLLVGLGLLLIAVAAGMAFAVLLAGLVRERRFVFPRMARAAAVATLRYVGFLALIGAAIVGVVVAASLTALVALVIGVNLLPVLGLLLTLPALAAALALAFVGEAIVLAEVGPLRAVYLSFGVVRRYPLATVGLLMVLLVVAASLPRLASNVTTTWPGLVVAIVVNGFVATGLALARMQFFYDRLRRWRVDLIPAAGAAGT